MALKKMYISCKLSDFRSVCLSLEVYLHVLGYEATFSFNIPQLLRKSPKDTSSASLVVVVG